MTDGGAGGRLSHARALESRAASRRQAAQGPGRAQDDDARCRGAALRHRDAAPASGRARRARRRRRRDRGARQRDRRRIGVRRQQRRAVERRPASTASSRRGRPDRRSSHSCTRWRSTRACSPRHRWSTTARSPSRPSAACTCRRTTIASFAAWSACAPRSAARSTCRPCARWSWSASIASTAALRQLGFDTLTEPDEYYGASLALGGADVNLLALDQRLPRARQRRRVRRAALRCLPSDMESRTAASVRRAGKLRRDRHPLRPRRARRHLRARESARDARLERGQDRHQQGHARQLVRRLHVALHRRRLGRQFFRCADARCLRRHRRRADLARPHPSPARSRAVGRSHSRRAD